MIVNGQISIDEITPDMPESEIKKIFAIHQLELPEKFMVPLMIQLHQHGGIILKGVGDHCEFTWKNIELVLTQEEALRLAQEAQRKENERIIILPPGV